MVNDSDNSIFDFDTSRYRFMKKFYDITNSQ